MGYRGYQARKPTERMIWYAEILGIEEPERYTFAQLSEMLDYYSKRRSAMALAEAVGCADIVPEDATPKQIEGLVSDFCDEWLLKEGALTIGSTVVLRGRAYHVEAVWPDTHRVTLRPIEGGRAHAYRYHEVVRGVRSR
jgi:hypothetical protein